MMKMSNSSMESSQDKEKSVNFLQKLISLISPKNSKSASLFIVITMAVIVCVFMESYYYKFSFSPEIQIDQLIVKAVDFFFGSIIFTLIIFSQWRFVPFIIYRFRPQ